ncbi:hypothetical protein BSLA_03r0798 [Burkholderia stabilis]|nr:hypothetical protein BSLA_03r0798 [Burkholderia stabilis]
MINADLVRDTQIFPTDEQVKSFWLLEPMSPTIRCVANQLWTQFKAGR